MVSVLSRCQALQLWLDLAIVVVIEVVNEFGLETFQGVKVLKDSAPDREVGECQGDPACDAQAEPAVGRSPPQAIYPLSAGRPQVSQSVG